MTNPTLPEPKDESSDFERGYIEGQRRSNVTLLGHVLSEFWGEHKPDAARVAQLRLEREETVAQLRKLCAKHGDNDWPDDMHLAAVLAKHLCNHLDYARESAREKMERE